MACGSNSLPKGKSGKILRNSLCLKSSLIDSSFKYGCQVSHLTSWQRLRKSMISSTVFLQFSLRNATGTSPNLYVRFSNAKKSQLVQICGKTPNWAAIQGLALLLLKRLGAKRFACAEDKWRY